MAYVGLLLVVLLDNALRLLAPGWIGMQTGLPDLPLITALYVGFRARDTGDLGLAVVLGVFADCFSADPIGHFAFLYGTAAFCALRIRRYVPPDAFVSHVIASFFCGLVACFFGLVLAIINFRGASVGFVHALAATGASALFAPFVFGIWDKSRFFSHALRRRGYEFA